MIGIEGKEKHNKHHGRQCDMDIKYNILKNMLNVDSKTIILCRNIVDYKHKRNMINKIMEDVPFLKEFYVSREMSYNSEELRSDVLFKINPDINTCAGYLSDHLLIIDNSIDHVSDYFICTQKNDKIIQLGE